MIIIVCSIVDNFYKCKQMNILNITILLFFVRILVIKNSFKHSLLVIVNYLTSY